MTLGKVLLPTIVQVHIGQALSIKDPINLCPRGGNNLRFHGPLKSSFMGLKSDSVTLPPRSSPDTTA